MSCSANGAVWRAVAIVGVLGAVGACASAPRSAATVECGPREGTLARGFEPGSLVGEYRLIAMATGGANAGTETDGNLTLMSMPAELRTVPGAAGDAGTPLYGTTSLQPERIGARRPGSLESDDPSRPGVLGLGRYGESPSLMLRLGADANRRDLQPFESAYTVLEVQGTDENGFYGRWRSGLQATEAEGYFCAIKK